MYSQVCIHLNTYIHAKGHTSSQLRSLLVWRNPAAAWTSISGCSHIASGLYQSYFTNSYSDLLWKTSNTVDFKSSIWNPGYCLIFRTFILITFLATLQMHCSRSNHHRQKKKSCKQSFCLPAAQPDHVFPTILYVLLQISLKIISNV